MNNYGTKKKNADTDSESVEMKATTISEKRVCKQNSKSGSETTIFFSLCCRMLCLIAMC